MILIIIFTKDDVVCLGPQVINFSFYIRPAMVPTFSILGEGSTIESLESITNPDVAKVVLPGQNRPLDALKTVNKYQRKGKHI